MENDIYKKLITEMVKEIDNEVTLARIYTYIKYKLKKSED